MVSNSTVHVIKYVQKHNNIRKGKERRIKTTGTTQKNAKKKLTQQHFKKF